MKAVVDSYIPYIRESLESLVDEVVYVPGSAITPRDVKDADVLIVRTRTLCNRSLLEGSSVKLVLTATDGFDHLDTAYLDSAGIRWANCPGCNATSVAQYVRNCLILWQRNSGRRLRELTVGIVGVGHVGKAVCEALAPFGCRLLLHDPPREEKEGTDGFSSMAELQRECDIITIHTPLSHDGAHPTYHLFDDALLRSFTRKPLLINTSRGEVVDNVALLRAINEGLVSQAIIDTWENEPHPLPQLLERAYIGTPHIAGYSADGRANAARITLESLCRWMGKEITFHIAPPDLPEIKIPLEPAERALTLYNPMTDSQRLKANPELFEHLRENYPLRREHVSF